MDGLDVHDDLTEEQGEPINDLVIVSLNDGNKDHIVQINSNLREEVREQLIKFLWRNADIFAWVPTDMPEIDAEVMKYHLTVDPKYWSVKEKMRSHAPER